MITLVIRSFYADSTSLITEVTSKTIFTYVIQKLLSIGLISIVCTSIIESFLTTKCVKKIFLNTEEMALKVLKEFNICIDFNAIRKSVWKKLSVVVIFLLVLHGTYLFASYGLVTFHEMLQRTIGIVVTFFFLMIIFKLIFYVEMVNNQLILLEKFTENFPKSKPREMLHSFRFLTLDQKLESEDHSRQVHTMCKIYELIYENGALVNASHGLTSLVILSDIVVACTILGYQAFMLMVGDLPKEKIANISCTIILALVILVVVVTYCQKTQDIVSIKPLKLMRS